jgi:DNA-directed RNA polymerase subunit RPC12/RpoP
MSISHMCIKCGANYSDEEVDDYYCTSCNEAKKAIAKEVDTKIALRGPRRQVKSDLQIYDEIRKARGVPFVSIKDLGIKL